MHAKVNETNNLRDTSQVFAIGGVLTQGIAIDELFGREERREQTQAPRDKSYRTFVKYRVTDIVRDS